MQIDLDAFRKCLLEAFDGIYEGPLEHYLGCEIARDLVAGTTQLSQPHYAEEVLRTFGFWDDLPRVTPMKPNTRLSKDDCGPSSKPDFHKRYHGIVGSLGYLVTMTRPDLAWSYSELSKYVQFPGQSHMEAAEHVLRYLRASWNETITYTCGCRHVNELWGQVDADWAGDTDTRRSHAGYILMMNGGPIPWKSRRKIMFLSRLQKLNSSQPAKQPRKWCIYAKRSVILDTSNPQPLTSLKTTRHASL